MFFVPRSHKDACRSNDVEEIRSVSRNVGKDLAHSFAVEVAKLGPVSGGVPIAVARWPGG
jgi:hypothetical protein